MDDDTIVNITFELFPGRTLTLLPYINVENATEVFQHLKSGDLPQTGFINSAYVLSLLQIKIAANKALYMQQTQTMVTKDIHLELIHSLSAQRNVRP